MSKRHLINSSDVFVIKGFTVLILYGPLVHLFLSQIILKKKIHGVPRNMTVVKIVLNVFCPYDVLSN